MSVQVSYKKQTLLGLLLIIILFSVVEGVAQVLWYDIQNISCNVKDVYFEGTDSELIEKICFDYHNIEYTTDNIRRNLPNQDLNTFSTNSFGFRGSEFDIETKNNEYRIIMVGGSTTFGMGATNNDTTIPAFLEKKLNDNLDLDITVINAGVMAATSREEVFYIKNDLIKFNPDLIIILDGYNDSFNIKLSDVDESEEYRRYDKDEFKESVKKYVEIIALPNIIYQYTHDYMQIQYLTEDVKNANTQKWLERWNNVCQFSKQHDFELFVMLQPMIGTSDREMHEIEKEVLEKPRTKKALELLNSLGNSLDELQCSSADLRGIFEGVNEQVFFDEVHSGDFGNEIIAERVFIEILPLIVNEIEI